MSHPAIESHPPPPHRSHYHNNNNNRSSSKPNKKRSSVLGTRKRLLQIQYLSPNSFLHNKQTQSHTDKQTVQDMQEEQTVTKLKPTSNRHKEASGTGHGRAKRETKLTSLK
jgi:hypothetical protein